MGHRRCARCTTCCIEYTQEDLSSDCERSPDQGELETDRMHDENAVYDVAYILGQPDANGQREGRRRAVDGPQRWIEHSVLRPVAAALWSQQRHVPTALSDSAEAEGGASRCGGSMGDSVRAEERERGGSMRLRRARTRREAEALEGSRKRGAGDRCETGRAAGEGHSDWAESE